MARSYVYHHKYRNKRGEILTTHLVRRDPTQAELKERLSYDPETGLFRHRKSIGKGKAGEVAGSLSPTGYIHIRLFNLLQCAHRLAWLYMTGEFPKLPLMIDHANCQRADNRWCNLRLATHQQNMWNSPALKHCQSGLKGAWPCKTTGRWQSIVTIGRRRIWLGRFDTAEEAARSHDAAVRELHGEFARTNF